jgi:hypothetical protein
MVTRRDLRYVLPPRGGNRRSRVHDPKDAFSLATMLSRHDLCGLSVEPSARRRTDQGHRGGYLSQNPLSDGLVRHRVLSTAIACVALGSSRFVLCVSKMFALYSPMKPFPADNRGGVCPRRKPQALVSSRCDDQKFSSKCFSTLRILLAAFSQKST